MYGDFSWVHKIDANNFVINLKFLEEILTISIIPNVIHSCGVLRKPNFDDV